MSKNDKTAPKAPVKSPEAVGEAVDPSSLKNEEVGVFVAATNISTGDIVYKPGEELNPKNIEGFDRLLEIGAVRVESPKEEK